MLHISTERLAPLPPVSFAEQGDPPPPGDVKIKPPTVSESATSEGGADIKPPTVSSTSDDNPPEASGQDPIIITGG